MILKWSTWLKKKFVNLLTKYDFPGDEIPVIRGSAVKSIEGDQSEIGVPCNYEIDGCSG